MRAPLSMIAWRITVFWPMPIGGTPNAYRAEDFDTLVDSPIVLGNPVTRTFEVKVGLTDPPAAMRLGSTVVGRMQLEAAPVIEIPASALTGSDGRPAVWVVDPKSLTVSLRNVEVARNDPATVAISDGLAPGEIVVTAGTQALHPGQKTRLLDSPQ